MTVNILDYGAVADGRTINTQAINAAVAACAAQGGGRVVVPAGGAFLTGTIWLKSHVELHLAHGALLLASGEMKDYNADDAYPQNFGVEREQWTGAHLILAVGCVDVAITGTGTIDGNAGAFVTEQDEIPQYRSPYLWSRGFRHAWRPGQMVCMVECQQLRLEGVTLRNAPAWTAFFHGCDHVQVRGVRVFNAPYMANTDGLDIDSCRYVTVSDCMIDTGDDAIALRNATRRLSDQTRVCEYVTITNCVLASSSSVFRIGVGQGLLQHIRVSNIIAHRGAVLMDFCTEYPPAFHTPLRDINFSNISADDISRPFVVSNQTGVPVSQVTLENIRCQARAAALMTTQTVGSLQDITLRNVDIFLMDDPEEMNDRLLAQRGDYALECRGVTDLRLEGVRIFAAPAVQAKWQGMVRVDQCPGLTQRDCRFDQGS